MKKNDLWIRLRTIAVVQNMITDCKKEITSS